MIIGFLAWRILRMARPGLKAIWLHGFGPWYPGPSIRAFSDIWKGPPLATGQGPNVLTLTIGDCTCCMRDGL